MGADLWAAFALVLIIEGLLPALAPDRWREAMRHASQLSDRSLRMIGLGAIIAGVLFLQLSA